MNFPKLIPKEHMLIITANKAASYVFGDSWVVFRINNSLNYIKRISSNESDSSCVIIVYHKSFIWGNKNTMEIKH